MLLGLGCMEAAMLENVWWVASIPGLCISQALRIYFDWYSPILLADRPAMSFVLSVDK